MFTAVRVFYKKSTGVVVWYHLLDASDGKSDFPTTAEDDIAGVPDSVLSYDTDDSGAIIGTIKVGGSSDDYACALITDPSGIEAAMLPEQLEVRGKRLIMGESEFDIEELY